ncbi:hypothetical protein GGX14DRAFT_632424 [Mycena pura]|uniref:Uncharacterized protein n=1 Tax=Mycena pura TaxID=153505 RepID=A0AAD6VDS6_9AGAR|nr:hypothetical protein GGX14DRAFT_632424 [Mycena pura]
MAKFSSILFLLCTALCAAAGATGIYGRQSGFDSEFVLNSMKVVFHVRAAQDILSDVKATNLTDQATLSVAKVGLESTSAALQTMLGAVVQNVTFPPAAPIQVNFGLRLTQGQLGLVELTLNETLVIGMQQHITRPQISEVAHHILRAYLAVAGPGNVVISPHDMTRFNAAKVINHIKHRMRQGYAVDFQPEDLIGRFTEWTPQPSSSSALASTASRPRFPIQASLSRHTPSPLALVPRDPSNAAAGVAALSLSKTRPTRRRPAGSQQLSARRYSILHSASAWAAVRGVRRPDTIHRRDYRPDGAAHGGRHEVFGSHHPRRPREESPRDRSWDDGRARQQLRMLMFT